MTLRDRRLHDHLSEKSRSEPPVQRLLGRVSVSASEVTPVEEALRRAQARVPAPRRNASLGVEANPRDREPQANVSFESAAS